MQTRDKVAHRPEGAHKLHEPHPKGGVGLVLFGEAAALVGFLSESPHDPYARQIFLHDGRHNALFGVCLHECPAYLSVKKSRITHDDGYERRCRHREQTVYLSHEHGAYYDEENYPRKGGHIHRYELLYGIDVRGAALQNIACLVLSVPGHRQTVGVGKEQIAYALHEPFRADGVGHALSVPHESAAKCHARHGEGGYPELAAHVIRAARQREQTVVEAARVDGFAAENVVYHAGDYPRVDKVDKRRDCREQHGYDKKSRAPFECVAYERGFCGETFPCVFIHFHSCHFGRSGGH